MTSPHISGQLIEWARRAGYELTPEDHSGAALFWSCPGGEIRYYIRLDAGGVLLTKAERAAEEQFELWGASIDVIERHLFGVFGWDIRSINRLPRIKTSRKIEEIADGYRITDVNAEGYRRLLDQHGSAVATARGKLSGVSVLVELSHLITVPIEKIRSSYEHPDGRPLFRV
ncbi:hypothetical protein FR943_24805 [Mycobacterium sp. TNTM28]|uniref:Immunity factor for TNT n=1 Tax=[Mycobacterium] fortunisiensis TaxID=2600579 RepID=A0ABS6KTR7_9MYCO|nr:Imm61 family immunity protein [[Mycobacterium] fortunisiensis]MBU9767043.1 hypothetical protein [[Mycobacterium] fortunisiensis]